MYRKEIVAHFWLRVARVDDGTHSECWNWKGAITKDGYGSLRIKQKTIYAHRLAFELSHRPLEPNEHVLHTCDNPRCCNPSHLRAGSHADNMADMAAKHRGNGGSPGGSRQGNSKLDEVQVASIRRQYNGKNRQDLARMYNVTPQAINYVISKGWRHVS